MQLTYPKYGIAHQPDDKGKLTIRGFCRHFAQCAYTQIVNGLNESKEIESKPLQILNKGTVPMDVRIKSVVQ